MRLKILTCASQFTNQRYRDKKQRVFSALVFCLLLSPGISNAATEYASFESFYRQPAEVAWILAGVAALLAGAIIFLTGGTASPIVAGVGTWIGGLMGYSGIAATNAGLALLGGGSIATGGFGIIGGTALLTAAFSFGTNVVLDYAAGKAVDVYQYSKFVKNSKSMTTLPLPESTSGPKSCEAALKILGGAEKKDPLSTNQNQRVILDAIRAINLAPKVQLTKEDTSREQSLLALLHFQTNNYVAAKNHAAVAYRFALGANVKATLPAFIYAASTIYDEKPDFNRATAFFRYATANESDNPLTPLLFAIYLDRMMYRFNDGYLSSAALDRIYDLSKPLPYDERKAIIQLGILSRYFIVLKLAQQKVLTLSRANNRTIKDSPKTLETVRMALKEYKSLLTKLDSVISEQSEDIALEMRSDWRIKGWELEWNSKISELHVLRAKYADGIVELESRVKELEIYQAHRNPVARILAKSSLWPYALAIVAILLLGACLLRRHFPTQMQKKC